MIRTIFFDFGNVIGFFDHQKAISKLSNYTTLKPIELTLAIYGGPLEDDYETGKLTTEEFVASACVNGRLTCTPDEFLAAFVDVFDVNEELKAFIPNLKPKYRLVLASNTNNGHFVHYREQFKGVLQHFEHFVVSHEAKARKPHPEFFAYASKFANAEPNECIFVDDLPTNVMTAQSFGWHGIVYRDFEGFRAQLSEHGVGW